MTPATLPAIITPDDQLEEIRLAASAECSPGTDAERLSWRLSLEVVAFLRRNPTANWDTVRDAMDRVSDLIRNARVRNRACHWSPRRQPSPR